MKIFSELAEHLVSKERDRVVEPPIGELSRVHELMGSKESRGTLRKQWQLSDEEMTEMNVVFEGIAKLHDLISSEDITKVLKKRRANIKSTIGRELYGVINRVRQQSSSNRLSPTPPDTGEGGFGDEVESFIDLIDNVTVIDQPSKRLVEVMQLSLRNTYTSRERVAVESVRNEVKMKIEQELTQNKAWRIVKDAASMTDWSAKKELMLRESLITIGRYKRPDLSEQEIIYQVDQNYDAIIHSGKVSGNRLKAIKSKYLNVKGELAKNPDSTVTTLEKCSEIVKNYLSRHDRSIDPVQIKMLDARLARFMANKMLAPISSSAEIVIEDDMFFDLYKFAKNVSREQIDNQVLGLLKESRIDEKLVVYINDPPHRRESMVKWQDFVKKLLSRRQTEARYAPTVELLASYRASGGKMEEIKTERPELWESIERINDMKSII